jgi:hypothetical protein
LQLDEEAIAMVFSKVEVNILRWLIIPLLGSWLPFHGFWKEDKKLVVHVALKFCIGFCSCHMLSGCLQFEVWMASIITLYTQAFSWHHSKLQMSKCEVRPQGLAIPKTRGLRRACSWVPQFPIWAMSSVHGGRQSSKGSLLQAVQNYCLVLFSLTTHLPD